MNKRQRKLKVVAPPAKPRELKINSMLLARSKAPAELPKVAPYIPPEGVIPAEKRTAALAMDSTDYNYVNVIYGTQYFKGYPYLALLAQRPEFRKMSETIAREMTRKWIRIVCTGDEDKSEKIKAITDATIRYRLREHFQKAALHDGLYGRGQLYIDVKMPSGELARENPEELEAPLFVSPAKIEKGALLGFNVVEPVWTYPGQYNSTDPLRPDYYKPAKWFVMGKTVHASRMMMFISREIPDLLKAAYNFGGLSLSQMAEPYVDNWIRTRNSVGDMVHSFSINGVKTNMQSTLQGAGGDELFNRAELFNNLRDNRGMMLLDKDTEEFFQFNIPLTGLDTLQAQAQEQMASVSSIPLVFLLGITPQGLNASSEGEILVFETTIHAMQELLFTPNLKRALDIIQLSEFGEIDPEITFQFEPLREMTAEEEASIRKINADTDATLITNAIISPDEARMRLSADPDSPYHGLEGNVDVDPDEGD